MMEGTKYRYEGMIKVSNDKEQYSDQDQSKSKKKTRISLIIGVVILIAILLMIFRSCSSDPIAPADRNDPVARPGVGEVLDGELPNMSDEQIREYLKKIQDASRFKTQVSSAGTIKSGSRTLNLLVQNHEDNSIDCYIEVFYEGEVIYTSPILKPKQFIKTIELSRELPEGATKLILRYNGIFEDRIVNATDVDIQAVSITKEG
ncbi:hypothetical protein [Paenibacillus humicus]|uniref:hypothetical protein n=2 Tax=Paenibacillus TaxID=44249 RepID=UPI001C3F737E|nr:hypothetical protein [Paenibacillus humicus]